MPLTKDEIREKKKLAERKRMENIRKDPEKYAQWKLKMKEMYLKRKKEGKILSVQHLPPKQQILARKKSRESSRRWYVKKKLKVKDHDNHSEDEIIDECDSTNNTEINDPLDLELKSPPGVSTIPRSPETLSSSQVLQSSQLCTRVTRSTTIQNRIFEPDLNLTKYENDVLYNTDVQSRIIKSPSRNTSISDSPRAHSLESSIILSPEPVVSPKAAQQKKKSHWKHIIRKLKSRYNKELQLKDQKILELKRENENYRKKIKRLENIIRVSNIHKRQKKNVSENEEIQLADSCGAEIKDESQFVTDESETEIKIENLM